MIGVLIKGIQCTLIVELGGVEAKGKNVPRGRCSDPGETTDEC